MKQEKGNYARRTPLTSDVRLSDKLKDPGNLLIGFFVLSALTYMALGFVLGGWALGGKVDGGVYYLGYRKQYTQVSRVVYTYSLWHGYSQPIVLLLLIPFEPKHRNRILF